MGIDLLTDDKEYLTQRIGMSDPATSFSPYSTFDNFFGAQAQGAVSGFADAGEMALNAMDISRAYVDAVSGGTSLSPISMFSRGYGMFTDTYEKTSGQNLRDGIKDLKEWSKIDPKTTGATSMMFGQIVRQASLFGVGTLAGGPLTGATLLGTTEGYTTYNDMRDQGVDPNTSLGLGALVGVTSGAGALLPVSIGAKSLTGMMASGAAINATAGIVQRGWMSTILEANGYKDMAANYRQLDAEALAADMILGAAFGGIARWAEGRRAPDLPTRAEIEAALEIERQAMKERGTFGLPINEEARALDAEISDSVVDALLSGRDVEIDGNAVRFLSENTVVDPVTADFQKARLDVAREELGDLADVPDLSNMREPEVAPRPETDAAPETPKPPEQQDAFSDIDPTIVEQINRLSEDPELEVELYDGTVVKAGELKQKISESLAATKEKMDLFDTAAACMLGTET
jgi:hypothetical protein